MVRTADECVCLCLSVCWWKKKEGGGGAKRCPAGFPLVGVRIAWALKGLKVSGVPSPPRTDGLTSSKEDGGGL